MRPLDNVRSEGRSSAAGAQEAQCMEQYMSISSTAGGRDGERSSYTEVSS
jgi:hypothetical protein